MVDSSREPEGDEADRRERPRAAEASASGVSSSIAQPADAQPTHAPPSSKRSVEPAADLNAESDAESEAEFAAELSELAEAYEESLLAGNAEDDAFLQDHPDLAQMLRLLNGVLGEGSRGGDGGGDDPTGDPASHPASGGLFPAGQDVDAPDSASDSLTTRPATRSFGERTSDARLDGSARVPAGRSRDAYLGATRSHPGLPNDAPTPTVLPDSLGRFDLRECLGQGGYGAVYRGYDTLLKREVAIKVVHASRIGRNSAFSSIDMVLHEARNVAQLRHPNIVSVYDAVLTEPYLYLVYELCDGSTLSFWMETQREDMDPALAARIVEQLADALDHAHQRGMVHRDIKPDNILIDKSSEGANRLPFTARLADFGLALSDEGIEAPGRAPSPIDKAGTLEYLPPERLLDGAPASSPRGDLYSLGVVFYRLLTGQLPLEPDKPLVFLHKLGQANIPPPRRIRPSIPRDLDAICMKLLERDPRQRYSSARKLAEDLLRFRMGLSVSVRRRSPREHLLQFCRQFPVEAASLTSTVLMALLAGGALALLYMQLVRQQDQLEEDQRRATVAERRAAKMSMEADVQERRADDYLRYGVRAAYASDLPAAYDHWRMRQSTRAMQLLDQITQRNLGHVAPADDLRLLRAVLSRDQQLLQSHAAPATHLALTPNGQQLVTSFNDGEVIFQDLKTLRTPTRMSLESPLPIHRFALDRTGNYLSLAGPWAPGGQPEVRVVDTKSGKVLAAHRDLPGPVTGLAFTPHGRSLLVTSEGHEPRVLSPLDPSARQRSVPVANGDPVRFSTCDERWIAIGTNRELLLYDATSRQPVQTVSLPAAPRCVAWSRDQRWLAVALEDRADLWVIDREAPERPEFVLTGIEEPATCLSFSPGADQLVAGSVTGQVVSWTLLHATTASAKPDVDEGYHSLRPASRQRPHAGATRDVLALSDQRIVSAGADGAVVLFAKHATWTVPSLPTELLLESVTVSDDGQYLAAVASDGSLQVVDLGLQAAVYRLAPSPHRVTHVAFLESNLPELLVRWDHGRVTRHDAQGNERQVFAEGGSSSDPGVDTALAVSPFGQAAALLDPRNGLRIWNLRDPSSVPREAVLPGGSAMSFLGSHEYLLVSPASQPLLLARAESGVGPETSVMAVPFPSTHAVSCLLYDGLRQRVVCGDARGNLQLIDPRTRAVLATANHGDSPLTSLALTADGSSLLGGHADGSVRVWSASDLRFVGTLLPEDARGAVVMLRMSSRGDQLYLFRKRPGQPSPLDAIERITTPRDDWD